LILSGTRLLNRGLLVISPIILARLLPVESYGRYREFLVYVTMLSGIAAFGINSSLLTFVPRDPERGWRYVNQSILLTMASATVVVLGALLLHVTTGSHLLGEHPLAVVLYAWLFVNFDFWESLLIAERRPLHVLRYTTARLLARIGVATLAASLTKDVTVIIWSLVGMETVRVLISMSVWRARDRRVPVSEPVPGSWREQLEYCVPYGVAWILIILNLSVGSLFVAKILGAAALAQYSIGVYAQPIITVVRNSLSDVLLGAMAALRRNDEASAFALWQRSTVVTMFLLLPCGILLARYADVLVTTLFSENYRPAIIVFQLYTLVILRSSFDFAVPLRALNRTAPILRSNFVALVLNVTLMYVMLRRWGLVGAVSAYVISRLVEGAYLGAQTVRAYGISVRELARWRDLGKITGAAAAAAIVLYGSFWTDLFGRLPGAVVGSVLYLATFVVLLRLTDVREVTDVLRRVQGYSRGLLSRFQA
jgi:O-antigen/teichoic acid export membrane protein